MYVLYASYAYPVTTYWYVWHDSLDLCILFTRATQLICTLHVTYMKASCRTREWITSQRTWMGHLHMDKICRTRVNESWDTQREVTDDVPVVPLPRRILILGDSRRFLIDAAVLMRGPVCHDLTMVSLQWPSHCIYGCSVGVCVCCNEVVRQGKHGTWASCGQGSAGDAVSDENRTQLMTFHQDMVILCVFPSNIMRLFQNNQYVWWALRPSIKGTKRLFTVTKAIFIIVSPRIGWLMIQIIKHLFILFTGDIRVHTTTKFRCFHLFRWTCKVLSCFWPALLPVGLMAAPTST